MCLPSKCFTNHRQNHLRDVCVCLHACVHVLACMHVFVQFRMKQVQWKRSLLKICPTDQAKLVLQRAILGSGFIYRETWRERCQKKGFFKEGRSFIGVLSHQGAHLSSGYFFTKVRTVPHSTNMSFSFCCSQTLGATAATRSLRATSRSIVSWGQHIIVTQFSFCARYLTPLLAVNNRSPTKIHKMQLVSWSWISISMHRDRRNILEMLLIIIT